jgi:hypothetical protein
LRRADARAGIEQPTKAIKNVVCNEYVVNFQNLADVSVTKRKSKSAGEEVS